MGALTIPKEGIDIPGPVDWEQASHWIVYDEANYTVETWCKMGPGYRFIVRTRVRPMCESEIINVKLKGHSREAVLYAHGIIEPDYTQTKAPPRKRRFRDLFFRRKSYG